MMAPASVEDATAETSGADVPVWKLYLAGASFATTAGMLGLFNYTFFRVSAIEDDPDWQTYAASVANTQDVCEVAKTGTTFHGGPAPETIVDLCDEASTLEVLSIVSVVSAVLTSAAGTGLLISYYRDRDRASAQQETSSWWIAPRISGDETSLRFGARF